MPYETLLYEVDQEVATITLNRPAVLNAISPQMIEELQAVLNTVRDDTYVRAVVLTGAGRGFCSGADLKARQRVKPSEAPPDASATGAERLRGTLNPIILAIRTIGKPFIAAVTGWQLERAAIWRSPVTSCWRPMRRALAMSSCASG